MVARICGRPRLAVVSDVVLPELLLDRFNAIVVIFKESWFAPLRRAGITFSAFAKRYFPERRFIVIHHLEACRRINAWITRVIYDSILFGGNGDDFVFSADGEAPVDSSIFHILIGLQYHVHDWLSNKNATLFKIARQLQCVGRSVQRRSTPDGQSR